MENVQGILSSLLPFVVLILIFYFFIIRPQRNQQKKHKQMIEELKKGDKIVTNGGFICEVLKPEEGFFSVKLNDETIARVSKDFIAYKVEEQPAQ
ncbi:preprotein translocase subunit YajC [Helicobacter mustelae]|uniref:Sec translocon accessory complex subunit YajC n=1 Tax=Helicobacter mustelae (strain ATCC 43772 / CCUG 25715 / CIP 103759 / LMG 18044 / NCTC 12198 / R85-136P) TaxID=679897 RepID=D3UIE2_HELM1|nr:preprotein translocase subunit YajC [Helicobacter mustelae]CBG40265.1 protein export-membrane protein, YajC [Helicobacter mustelae 12198]SQH71764.1 protein export-membrane protein YajC [Helicobacter mustelae]STP12893.1 protein export-membrane protein YajC [Helicobacter mustelae]